VSWLKPSSNAEVHDGKITVWHDDFDLLTAAKINDPDAP
jgi:limonene-1,2-epoxide hydrolase